MAEKIKAIRGTKDILPTEVIYWQEIERLAQEVLDRSCYQEIRTPLFEQTSLFARGIGEATDVVGKEMYTFSDRKNRSITLRPEGTAGVARAFIENNLDQQGALHKLWYLGPMFRYERPQAGRQRQFHQLGIELLGTEDPRADVEVITIAVEILGKLGFKSLELNLNTVGSKGDRARYREALVAYLTPYKQDLDQDSQDRLDRNPLRILDSKDQTTQGIVADAPTIVDYLEDHSRQHFDRVQELLSLVGIEYVLNPCLVRGLDYYTHTAFEIISSDLGAQGTVCGGGRYDGLLEQLGGKNIPAVGWAMGLERLIILLQQLQHLKATSPDCYMIARGHDAEQQSFVLAHQLRQAGLKVEINFGGGNFGKQFKKADRLGAKLCLVIGEEEAQQRTVGMKWMATQESVTMIQDQLLADVEHIKTKVKG